MRPKNRRNNVLVVPQKAVEKIVEYLQDEEKHFEESDRPRNHIWRTVKKLQKALGDKGKEGI